MKKAYTVLALGIINACYSLGMFFSSINVETDEWGGTSYESSATSLIWLISSILIIVLGYFMYKESKETKNN